MIVALLTRIKLTAEAPDETFAVCVQKEMACKKRWRAREGGGHSNN
jgi:hypothetical protein